MRKQRGGTGTESSRKQTVLCTALLLLTVMALRQESPAQCGGMERVGATAWRRECGSKNRCLLSCPSASSYTFGDFAVRKVSNDEFSVRNRTTGRVIIRGEWLNCAPVYEPSRHLLIVADQNDLKCYTTTGHVVWSHTLDYFYNPGRMVLCGLTLIYDECPMTIGSTRAYSNYNEWLQAYKRAEQVRARNVLNGKLIWTHNWPSMGNPFAPFDSERFYTIRPSSLRSWYFGGKGSSECMELHSRATGKRLRRWRIPRKMVTKTLSLTQWLRNGDWVFRQSSQNESTVTFQLQGDPEITPYNCRIVINFVRRTITFRLSRDSSTRREIAYVSHSDGI